MVIRNYNWAVDLVRRGHKVTIVASAYSHYRNIQPTKKRNDLIKEEYIDGIRYLWVRGPHYKPNSALGRTHSLFYYTLQTYRLKHWLNKKYDVVIASSPQPFCIWPAARIARQHNAKLVYDIRDLWPLTLTELGNMSRYNPIVWMMQRAENYACKVADLIAAVPNNCKDYLIKKGMTPEKFLAIGNGLLIKEHPVTAPAPKTHTDVIEKIKSNGGFVVTYTGAIGYANALHCLLEAAAKAKKNVHVVLVGKGNHIENLTNLAKSLEIEDRFHILPPIQHAEIQDLLSHADATYVGLHYTPLYFKMGASPTKLNDYMMAAKPIIYAIGDPNNGVELSGCGICCTAENIEQITEALNTLESTPAADLHKIGENGREWLFQNQIVPKQMDKILNKLFPQSE